MAIPSEGDVKLRHVAIDGPIGVGKTSLVELLSRRFHGTQILFFDDKPENVEAARAAGWRAERVDQVDEPVGQMRDFLARHDVRA